jgi:1-acyl-sn-glycerol-3-phosphate acyltransferase
LWYKFWRLIARFLFSLLFGIRAYGQKNVPAKGAVILAATHQSFLDPVVVGLAVSRPIHIMARETLFRNPFFGWFIRSLHAFPVSRGTADLGALRQGLDHLEAGDQMLLFPEATRTHTGEIGPLHSGIGIMAARSGAVVVPVTIEGAHECWPRQRKLFRLGKIRVIFGEPMRVDSPKRADIAMFMERLYLKLVEQQHALRRMAELD